MGDYDDERERPSWREIDRLRDRSRHVRREEKRERKERFDRWKSGRAKEALERLLKGEKGTLEHDKLLNKIHVSYGTEGFVKAVKDYVKKYGMPDDPSTLILIMDTKDDEIVSGAMEKLREIYGELKENLKEDARRKVSILRMSSKSSTIREKAQEFLESLNQI